MGHLEICPRCKKKVYVENGTECHTCSIPFKAQEKHKSYPDSERRARWSQYLSSGNLNILLRKEDRWLLTETS